MRIIAGSVSGRRLMSCKRYSIRPTADRIKEAVFNIIGSRVRHSLVLDLFAGTGGLGLEALSRGAEHATFVEKSPVSINVLNKNIEITGFKERSSVLSMDALKALQRFKNEGRVFDLIFIDPPYKDDLYEKILFSDQIYVIIRNEGLIIVESPASTDLRKIDKRLIQIKNKKYGNTAINIFIKGENNEKGSISGKL